MVTGVPDNFLAGRERHRSDLFIDRGGLPAVESFERYYRLEQEISLILA
jgi:hypothetical protein